MKNLAVTALVVLLVAALALNFVSFQVRETESALVTTFGKPSQQITSPGWYFKWPPPIQRLYKFDSRMRVLEAELGETTTRGAVPIIVNSYVVWRIDEPLTFFNAVGSVWEAENKLRSQINNTQNTVIGRHSFSEFVNSDRDRIRFEQIEREMLDDLAGPVREHYGIAVNAMGIKQLKVSADVSEDVFERMRAERNRRTEATIAQGNAEAARIRTEADSKKTELLAAAEARAKAVRGRGDAEAARYYKLLEADPDLAMFLRDIEALQKILKDRTTVVLSTDSEPFKLLREMPEFKKKEALGIGH
jgi:membrane protease subunit HflC